MNTHRIVTGAAAIGLACLLTAASVRADGVGSATIPALRDRLAEAGAHEGAARGRLQLQLGRAYQSEGQMDLAIASFNDAVGSAASVVDQALAAQAYIALAQALTWTRQFTLAEVCLLQAEELNRGLNDPRLGQDVTLSRGLLHATQGRFAEAQVAFTEVAESDAASASGRASAWINAARAAGQAGDFDAARGLAGRAEEAVGALDTSPGSRASMRVALGSLQHGLSPVRRHAALAEAIRLADEAGDAPVLTAALLELGALYESQDRTDEALRLTRRASFTAQQTKLPDLMYQAQWQTGRLLARDANQLNEAILSYERALSTVQSIRPDLSIRYSPVAAWPDDAAEPAPTFRRVIGPIYFELADLYFRRADLRRAAGDAAADEDLLAARDTVETFRTAEIEDYFQERCVNVIQGGRRDITRTDMRTAIVYYVPLRDRLEILVTRGGQLQRFTSPIGSADLDALADQFRLDAETRGSYDFMDSSPRLYEAIIRPFDSLVAGGGIDTLVFVPDGSLRTVPMAALYDGKQFLIERVALAVSPGLSLMQPRPIARQNVRMLLSGVSVAREVEAGPLSSAETERFSALPNVPVELDRVESVFGGRKLLNGDFTVKSVQDEVAEQPYTIVHIATHGEFRSEAADSFLLAYDGKMTLDRLEQIIRPAQFRGEPVELLTLSACRTAAGDDRAALGLAGVAIKAGARAALATMWYVDDEASSQLVARFYELLKEDPTLSKARALQLAQVELVRYTEPDGRVRLRHPALWSPYLIIGNWL